MLLIKLGLAVNIALAVFGEWQQSSHIVVLVAPYLAFSFFVILALAFTMKCVEDVTSTTPDDGPP